MKTRMILSFGLSALFLGGTMVGCTATGGSGIASASDRNAKATAKAAAASASRASKALAGHDAAGAIRFAETSVELAPRHAGYRMTLAQSYLQAGRFASARQAFADVLALAPGNGKAALDLALTQTATGDWAAARKTLDDNARVIPVSDLGLALALAGNPQGAVALLMEAARSSRADAKIRQNLALSLALSGNWAAARMAAAVDMSPADVDARMQQWAAFAQPAHAADQVAALLGVTPTQDSGQPVALALNAAVPMSAASDVAATPPSLSTPAIAVQAPAVVTRATVVFGPSREVVQAVPVEIIRAEGRATKVALAPTPVMTAAVKGDWYVQLGAYDNARVARDGWNRAKRRLAVLEGHQPNGMAFSAGGANFYRLSVGGFARAEADRLCRRYRGAGGACFVRKDGGDRTAQWLGKTGVEMASR